MPEEQQTAETQTQPVAAPVVPQGATLPTPDTQARESVEQHNDGTTISEADWGIFDKSKPAPKATPQSEQPAVEKREEPKPAEVKKPDEQQAPVEQKPPANEGDELPDLDKLDDNVPKTHKGLVKQRNKLGKELRLSREKEGQLDAKLKELEGKLASASPEKEAEFQKKIDALTADLDRHRQEAEEVRDRLYANELTARPDYQQHVVKPWADVQTTIHSICKKYGQNPDDVWAAYQMEKPEDRDNAFSEMIGAMTAFDQNKFVNAIERIPAITAAQKALQANSKERLQAYREADQQRQEREREGYTSKALASSKSHYEQLKSQMPYLYEPTGDEPGVQQYREAVKKALDLSEQIVRRGVDKLSPEIQGRMAHDALMADTQRNYLGGVIKQKDQTITDMQTKVKELEATVTTLQNELDGYRGAIPGGGGLPVGVTPNGSDKDIMEVGASLFPQWR